jgi:uncharacterized integral membrane protein
MFLKVMQIDSEETAMIRKIVAIVILLPLALLIMMFAVANRAPVTVGFDPLAAQPPMISGTLPLFVVVLTVLTVGVIIGGVASWARQGKWRRRARGLAAELKASRAETEALRQQLAAGAAAQARASTSLASIAYRHPSAA